MINLDKIKCFWIEPISHLVLQSLRRYTSPDSAERCVNGCVHNASTEIGKALVSECPKLYEGQPVHGDMWNHADLRWPTHCQCGYEFKASDEWQYNPDVLYRRTDTDELLTAKQMPAGAMRHAGWMNHFVHHVDTDGIILECKLPDGVWWCVDGTANNAPKDQPGWTRTGVIPDVTARPSIATPAYHGYLTNGYLEKC